MNREELRNLTYPLLQQPMPQEDVARGIAVAYGVSLEDAKSVFEELHADIQICIRHIGSIMNQPSVPSHMARAAAKREISSLAEAHFEAMWRWANFIVAKGG